MNNAQALKKTFLFQDMPQTELDKLAHAAKEEQISSGEAIFNEGDGGTNFYVIVLGSVVVQKNRDGQSEEVAHLGTGSYFGEMAVVDENHERSATIVAHESTTLLSFSQAALEKIFEKDHALAHHFYKSLARGLTRRLHATTQDAAFYKALARKH
jgi:CRP-like cAMP-binding protein